MSSLNNEQALLNLIGTLLHRHGNRSVSASVDQLETFAREHSAVLTFDGTDVRVALAPRGVVVPTDGEVVAVGKTVIGEERRTG